MTSKSAHPAPATQVAGGPLQIVVANGGDFTIQLTPPEKPLVERATNTTARRPRVVQFKVSKAILTEHSAVFGNLFHTRSDLPLVTFENKGTGFGYALEIWLRAIHHGANTLPPNLKATHTERAWVAIGVGEQFGFAPQHIDKIRPWFLDCYQYALNNGAGLTPMTACCLAFPCSVFDHAEGFMKLTKYLAYRTNGSIFTHNPSSFQSLNQDARILDGPLTTARAHLQSTLDKELYYPLDKLHRADCACRKETAFDYESALISLDCWPVDKAVMKYPIADIIDELEKFDFIPKARNCPSDVCNHDFKGSVQIAIRKAKFAFDGLCLDCMEHSQADELPRNEYMAKNSPYKGCFDINCRFGHGRASWYFSWMGPSSVRRDILSKYRQEKRTLGITSRGKKVRSHHRPGNRDRDRDDNTPLRAANATDHLSTRLEGMGITTRETIEESDKENASFRQDFEAEEDEEYFDAEDE